jgi:two-component system, OmpR family, sensor histidine kinase PhoQ
MKRQPSIRARLLLGAALVLVAFVAAAGFAVQRAHADSVRAAHFEHLQGTVYLLLAGAEIDETGSLQMPAGFPEPRLSLPGSGLYAQVVNAARHETWRSPSSVGRTLPFQDRGSAGQWHFDEVRGADRQYLALTYGVTWAGRASPIPLVISVLEDKRAFDAEVGVFARTLWSWLGGAALLLLVAQVFLVQWGWAPLGRVAGELRRIERGEQERVEGAYPVEITALTDNLNTLIGQERVRQTRFREALSFLAHSLKTPLAVLRTALDHPETLRSTVAEQVGRMDDIVQHQLGRAAASGTATFAPYLPVAPVLQRVRDSLEKVHADKALAFEVECAAGLRWRLDEGDGFELMGNLMDNAAKWARTRVAVRAWREGERLRLRVDDDGTGFSDTTSILQLHVRLDERVPGHGVGLAIVNDLVASHRGELQLGRSELGGGRVDVFLPAN